MPDRRFFSGKTVAQAVLKAASHYQIDGERIAYKLIEKKHGFINQRRGVVISVDPDAPELPASASGTAAPKPTPSTPAASGQPKSPAPPLPVSDGPIPTEPVLSEPAPIQPVPSGSVPSEAAASKTPGQTGSGQTGRSAPIPGLPIPSPPAPTPPAPASPAPASSAPEGVAATPSVEEPSDHRLDDDDPEMPPFVSSEPDLATLSPAQGEAGEAAHHAITAMLRLLGIQPEARVLQSAERLEIVLEGEDTDLLTQDNGEVLKALQFLVPRIVRGITGASTHCRVDAEGFHRKREQQLFELAWRVARRVDQSERPETLNAMPPDERRIVHLALSENQLVSTHSVGHGLYKRVEIRPA